MNRELATKVADAILYEGYMLYPYRPSAIKNSQRWTTGILYPPAYDEIERGTESARMHVECLFTTGSDPAIHVQLRFLHLLARQLFNNAKQPVESILVDGNPVQSWDEGVRRSVEFEFPAATGAPFSFAFDFPCQKQTEEVLKASGESLGSTTRTQQEVRGVVTCSVAAIGNDAYKLTIDVENSSAMNTDTRDRDRALLQSLLSAHLILSADQAEFVSLLDPPDLFRDAVAGCNNVRNFPFLVGDTGERDMMLCSPILLYDYPQIAPESAGDFFDGTEMDEMLTLRIMTLTEEEKDQMRMADDRVRALLQRTEESAREQLMKTHGTIRSMRPGR